MSKSFLIKQNFYLKIIYIIISLIFVFTSEIKAISVLLFINILFFLPIFLAFLKTLIKLSYFWIFYLFWGLIFNIDFMVQINFLLCMVFMLHISVFLQKTICFQIFLYDIKPLLRFNLVQVIILFFLNLNSSLKYLIKSYDKAKPKEIPLVNRFSWSYIESIMVLIKSVVENSDNRDKVETITPVEDLTAYSRVWANVYLIICYMSCIILFLGLTLNIIC